MFEQGYPYLLLSKGTKGNAYPLVRTINYRFTNSKGKKYLVPIQEFDKKVFALKFHLWEHKNHPKKYNLIVNQFDFGPTVKTILNISIEILKYEPMASFGFVGVHKLEKEQRGVSNTQRFRVYRRITENFFGDQTFLHGYSEQSNAYLLINRANTDPVQMYQDVVQMFSNEYPEIAIL